MEKAFKLIQDEYDSLRSDLEACKVRLSILEQDRADKIDKVDDIGGMEGMEDIEYIERRPDDMPRFSPSKEQWEEAKDWMARHSKECHPRTPCDHPRKYDPSAARYIFCFEPSQLGMLFYVECATCRKKNVAVHDGAGATQIKPQLKKISKRDWSPEGPRKDLDVISPHKCGRTTGMETVICPRKIVQDDRDDRDERDERNDRFKESHLEKKRRLTITAHRLSPDQFAKN